MLGHFQLAVSLACSVVALLEQPAALCHVGTAHFSADSQVQLYWTLERVLLEKTGSVWFLNPRWAGRLIATTVMSNLKGKKKKVENTHLKVSCALSETPELFPGF